MSGRSVIAAVRPQPLLLTSAIVYCSASTPPVNAALLLVDGKIAFLGSEADALRLVPGARVAKCPGAFIYPGLIDAHAHLLNLGIASETLALRGKQRADIVAIVRDAAAKSESGVWLRGRNWDQNLWPEREFPAAAELTAAAPLNPVALTRVDGHALWVNEEALRQAGITEHTPDPDGGRLVRDPAGRPTGILLDQAMKLVLRAIPERSECDLRRCFAAGAKACTAVGLTGVGDGSGYACRELDVLLAMAREGTLPLRVYATVGGLSGDLSAFLTGGPITEGRLTVRAVKLFADGALGSRSAALLSDYSDAPGNRGILISAAESLNEATLAVVQSGWQVWIHAIGDHANRLALEACEKAIAIVKPTDPRLRIEHAQHLAPEDFSRFAKLGVIASVQPVHATSDMQWAETRVGRERIRRAYAWRSFLKAGARLAGGSDFPVEQESPFPGIYAAVTRQDADGNPPEGWYSDQRLTRQEALRLFTEDAAYAEFAETRRGRIAPGFDADLTVLDRDLLANGTPPTDILQAKVVMTVVGGEVVYSAAAQTIG